MTKTVTFAIAKNEFLEEAKKLVESNVSLILMFSTFVGIYSIRKH